MHICEAATPGSSPSGDAGIELDRTVFYAAGGGQPGDTGSLRRADGASLAIVDTRYGDGERILHLLAPGAVAPGVGETVTLELDWDRRYAHMRMHTCLHLLGAVLRYGVTGGSIGAERSRLDFDMQDTVDREAVDAGVNALIEADHAVRTLWITQEELAARAGSDPHAVRAAAGGRRPHPPARDSGR